MARGVRHDPALRAAAVSGLLTGQSPEAVAKDLNLPIGTVKGWKRQIDAGGYTGGPIADQPVDPKNKQVDYGELVASYLRENLTTLAEQQKHFRDKDWLKRQRAADLAVLHGVTADKAIRILEASERARERAGEAP